MVFGKHLIGQTFIVWIHGQIPTADILGLGFLITIVINVDIEPWSRLP